MVKVMERFRRGHGALIAVICTILSVGLSPNTSSSNMRAVEGFQVVSPSVQSRSGGPTASSRGKQHVPAAPRRFSSRLLIGVSSPSPGEKTDSVAIVHQRKSSSSSSGTIANTFGRPLAEGMAERNKQVVNTVKGFLFDTLYRGREMERSYARFYALETIARMPYFSYLSVLHLFETLGFWRQADALKTHFSESWNELHHLLIMEELGGHAKWSDRFIAQHIAFFYYWIVVSLYLYNPVLAYNLNQCVEEEAYQTYNSFLEKYSDQLKTMPAPVAAIEYYTGQDLYLFDCMHTENEGGLVQPRRRPVIQNLYDVFLAIRDDEMEHVKTMSHFQQ